MLSSSLLSGLIISVISTGIYILITDNKKDLENDKNYKNNKKIECCTIFCIIMLVSVIILYFTNKNNDKIVSLKTTSPSIVNNNPPF
tara:strand:+ start:261 stop:521 length:261 start_codon:yes stop_codon:yes gene_type:complete